jgi:hypothetical protein
MVKRYNIYNSDSWKPVESQDRKGKYVHYDDYKIIHKQYAKLIDCLKEVYPLDHGMTCMVSKGSCNCGISRQNEMVERLLKEVEGNE